MEPLYHNILQMAKTTYRCHQKDNVWVVQKYCGIKTLSALLPSIRLFVCVYVYCWDWQAPFL